MFYFKRETRKRYMDFLMLYHLRGHFDLLSENISFLNVHYSFVSSHSYSLPLSQTPPLPFICPFFSVIQLSIKLLPHVNTFFYLAQLKHLVILIQSNQLAFIECLLWPQLFMRSSRIHKKQRILKKSK